jgi:hypothetical protein
MDDSIVRISREDGRPIRAGGRTLTPQVQTVRLKIPRLTAGMIWRRPYAVLVKDTNGEETILPVVDVTRTAQMMTLLAGVLAVSIIWYLRRSNNE